MPSDAPGLARDPSDEALIQAAIKVRFELGVDHWSIFIPLIGLDPNDPDTAEVDFRSHPPTVRRLKRVLPCGFRLPKEELP